MQTRNTAGPRNPEAQQLHEGKPTSTQQRTRVTTSAAKPRRRTTKDKPQPPQASSQYWKREGRTQGKAQERAGAWTIQRPESPSENPGQGKVSTTKRREEPRHGLPTQVLTNAQGRDSRRQKERVQPEAKASGQRNRASEESKTQESQEGPQTCDQATPTPEKVKDQQTQEKDEEPLRAAETAFAAHKRLRHRRPEAHPP